MFEDRDPRHGLGEEEEEEEGPEESEGDDEESSREGGPSHPRELGGWYPDPAYGSPFRWGPQEAPCCRCPLFLDACSGPICCNGAEAVHPWERETPPREKLPCLWLQDVEANQPPEQVSFPGASSSSSSHLRTLSHPSYQSFYSAVALHNLSVSSSPQGHVWSSELEPKAGSPLRVDCSGFFYTDPTMPPGHRIYNWLSSSSQEVFHHLHLNTPAPIMAVHQTPPLPPPPPPLAPKPPHHRRWLSELECEVAYTLLELPGAAHPGMDGCWSPSSVGKTEERLEKTSAPDWLL